MSCYSEKVVFHVSQVVEKFSPANVDPVVSEKSIALERNYLPRVQYSGGIRSVVSIVFSGITASRRLAILSWLWTGAVVVILSRTWYNTNLPQTAFTAPQHFRGDVMKALLSAQPTHLYTTSNASLGSLESSDTPTRGDIDSDATRLNGV
jgi:hypothetical protein